jgi:hypothetical protein
MIALLPLLARGVLDIAARGSVHNLRRLLPR